MPLVRPRCPDCAQPLGDPPYPKIPLACRACGTPAEVPFGADGQPVDFDAAFSPARLLRWLAAARIAMARGAPGIAVGACKRCDAALVVSSCEPVSLPCPHCGARVEGTASSIVVDQWPEPWTRVDGGGVALEYRVAVVDDTTGVTAGCASCGLATPANDPATTCPRCRAVTWTDRSGVDGAPAGRVQLGVRVDGTRQGRPFHVLVPVVQGEAMLRNDMHVGTSAESGSSVIGITALGCAATVGVTILLGLGMWTLYHFTR